MPGASISGIALPSRRPTPAFLETLYIGSFRRLLLSNGLSFMGRHYQSVAIAWLVLEMTNSKLWVGIVNGVPAISIIIFSLIGGILADRIDLRGVHDESDGGSGRRGRL